jgi:serine/threonine-protein kinase
MSASPERERTDLPRRVTPRTDQECDRFESAWKAGQRPCIEDCLAAVPEPERLALLRELILLEIDYRRLAGEQPRAEEFLARFTSLDRAWLERALLQAPPTATVLAAAEPWPSGAAAPPRLQLALAAAAGLHTAGDLQALLRRRLQFISLVIFAFYTYAGIAFVLAVLRNAEVLFRYWVYAWPCFVVFPASALLALFLWLPRPLPLPKLRMVELILFGLVLGQLAWELSCDLFLSPQFPGAARWTRTTEEEIYFLNMHSSYTCLPFFILIVSYATLIPSGWRRCTLVVGVMAVTPLTISSAACLWAMALPSVFALVYILPMGMILAIAVAVAAYGTHRIEQLRQEAAEARKLGQYQLKVRLGAGGMGEVYLAEHVLLKQPCALKLIRPERAGDPATLRRFEREVQATARLKHWNTVQIFDYGHTADGTFYYVMEYLPGPTLEQVVKQHGPLPTGRTVNLLCQACLALREAHALGLIHRDIKPANMLLCNRGGVADLVKLLDFGLVKTIGLTGPEEGLTQEGSITGTPAYMSPEQASCRELDFRTDIYSLGAVAYFLLTGQPPFQRDKAMQLLVAHIHEPVPPPTELRPDIPADVQAVVLRCLAKEPAQRYAEVRALHDALAACVCAGDWTQEMAAQWWQTQERAEDQAAQRNPGNGALASVS